MKQWYVVYSAKPGKAYKFDGPTPPDWAGVVVAEDDDIAEHVALEHIENDDLDPNDYQFKSCTLVVSCNECGGSKLAGAPPGRGAVHG